MDKVTPEPNTGCWLWTGALDKRGYGVFGRYIQRNRSTWRAHRLSYYFFKGDPASLFVCHSCDTPACVNPEHLWLGTHLDNMKDAKEKLRLSPPPRHERFRHSHCKRGHEWSEENTRLYKRARHCRACIKLGKRDRLNKQTSPSMVK